jgi:hypothetical protein
MIALIIYCNDRLHIKPIFWQNEAKITNLFKRSKLKVSVVGPARQQDLRAAQPKLSVAYGASVLGVAGPQVQLFDIVKTDR